MELIFGVFNFFIIGIVYLIMFILFSVVGAIVAGPTYFYKNDLTGEIKSIRKGFSFTYLFFGPLVPLIRGHFTSFIIALIIDLFSFGFIRIVYVFVINRTYANHLTTKGYVPFQPYQDNIVIDNEIIDV